MNEKKQIEIVDELPEDLDAQKAYRGPYLFPNTNRRKTAAFVYLALSIIMLIIGRNNIWIISTSMVLILVAIHHFFTGWNLDVNQTQALVLAGKEISESENNFSVGHASGRIFWYGWLSKPVWQVVVFSSEEPPKQKALVEVNACNGKIISSYFEENK